MSQKEEIPCSVCKLWDAQAKNFSCDPNKCSKLSEWLIERAPQLEMGMIQDAEAATQYVV